jgi:hypothetical protein
VTRQGQPGVQEAAARSAEPLPAAPEYGRRTVGEVFTSAAAAMGLPGFRNALELPAAGRVCVVVVDGLGMTLLRKRGGHAPFLRGQLDRAQVIGSAFPSTTASSLATLGTGEPPGRHGMVGYDVLDPDQDKVVNMLGGWDAGVDPLKWQPHPTVFEQVSAEVAVTTVSLPRFAGSAMTRAALRGGSYIAAGTAHARVEAAALQLAAADRALVYLYFNELDKAGHRHGCGSGEWGEKMEDLDHALRTLASRVPPDTLLLLTADHGMVDVEPARRIDYSAAPALLGGMAHTAGEPRMVHLYTEPDVAERQFGQLLDAWRDAFSAQAWILTRREAVQAGWFGPVEERVLPRIGDILVAAREPVAFYDTRRVPPAALEVVGQHGSLTRAEREVPLLTLGRPARVVRGSKGRYRTGVKHG